MWSAVLAAAQAQGYGIIRVLDTHTLELSASPRWNARVYLTIRAGPDGVDAGVVTVWARVEGWNPARARRIANAVLRAIPGVHNPGDEPQGPSQTGSIRSSSE
ncbi:hypothetical protein [Knoellia subterranea]|uniref:Uncharacterized protein n=1 Tax=Knoellia subterranea KCTC 19937 TaxID=1385521 RepID=A0A0A0JJ81_9MICO|nr:hypothetical protein [Knoellia subterranea]KGN36834.1 hypothetical protein N803_17125 [Knoellia subterranea KCTC 19937]